MKKKGTSLLMVVLTTLTVALGGCSIDKAGDSANSSQTPATNADTASSSQADADSVTQAEGDTTVTDDLS